MIEPDHPQLSITRQCALVGLSRSAFYGGPRTESAESLALMRAIDGQFLETPWYVSRQMVRHLRRQGHEVGRKRVRRLMTRMGLAAIYQRPKTTVRHPQHRIPAYAGEPRRSGCRSPMRRVHPRVGGGAALGPFAGELLKGPSPRGRGSPS